MRVFSPNTLNRLQEVVRITGLPGTLRTSRRASMEVEETRGAKSKLFDPFLPDARTSIFDPAIAARDDLCIWLIGRHRPGYLRPGRHDLRQILFLALISNNTLVNIHGNSNQMICSRHSITPWHISRVISHSQGYRIRSPRQLEPGGRVFFPSADPLHIQSTLFAVTPDPSFLKLQHSPHLHLAG